MCSFNAVCVYIYILHIIYTSISTYIYIVDMPKKTEGARDYPILNHSMHKDLLIGVVSRFGFDGCFPSKEIALLKTWGFPKMGVPQ